MIPTQMTKAILRMSPRTVDRAVVAAASASFRAPSCCVSRPATTSMALSSSSLPSGVLAPSIANWWNPRLHRQQQQQQQPKEELHNKHDCDLSHEGRAVLCRPAASWRFPSSSQPHPQHYQQQQQQQYRQIRHQHNGGGSSNNNNSNSSGVTNLMDYHFTILNLHTIDPVRAVMNLHHHLAPVPIAWVDLNNNTGSYYHHEHHHRTTTITSRPQPHELDLILAELTKALQLVESDDTYALSFSESSLDDSDVFGGGGGGGVGDDDVAVVVAQSPTLQLMNRNARRGKRANHGKRPCSRYRRRAKKRALGNHRR